MNREIKFRAWNTIVHRMQKFTLSDIQEQNGKIQWHILDVMQSTGFKDKNGTEIYEGDWLRSAPGYISFVRYDSKQAAYLSVYSHPEDGEELLLCDLGSGIEVIGNIYEKGDNNG